jgi:nicotinamide riboside kinase
MNKSFIIEGLDRLGKSTLISNIQQKLGFFQVIHYSKPLKLDAYNGDLRKYQYESFKAMFRMLETSADAPHHAQVRYILDRAHLGEAVYSPMYRGYDGNYVFDLEDHYNAYYNQRVRLILLTEDFTKSKHFVDDGLSLGPRSARAKEQELFLKAFDKSLFADKKIICVTGEDGNFRPADDILADVLEGIKE